MANLTLTSTTNSIQIAFNDLAPQEGKSHTLLQKRHTSIVKTVAGPVMVFIFAGPSFLVSATAANGVLKIDSINAVPMTTDQQIYDTLIILLA